MKWIKTTQSDRRLTGKAWLPGNQQSACIPSERVWPGRNRDLHEARRWTLQWSPQKSRKFHFYHCKQTQKPLVIVSKNHDWKGEPLLIMNSNEFALSPKRKESRRQSLADDWETPDVTQISCLLPPSFPPLSLSFSTFYLCLAPSLPLFSMCVQTFFPTPRLFITE